MLPKMLNTKLYSKLKKKTPKLILTHNTFPLVGEHSLSLSFIHLFNHFLEKVGVVILVGIQKPVDIQVFDNV